MTSRLVIPVCQWIGTAVRAGGVFAFVTVSIPYTHSVGPLLLPICTSAGTAFVAFPVDDGDKDYPSPDQASCHAPCLCQRKRGERGPTNEL